MTKFSYFPFIRSFIFWSPGPQFAQILFFGSVSNDIFCIFSTFLAVRVADLETKSFIILYSEFKCGNLIGCCWWSRDHFSHSDCCTFGAKSRRQINGLIGFIWAELPAPWQRQRRRQRRRQVMSPMCSCQTLLIVKSAFMKMLPMSIRVNASFRCPFLSLSLSLSLTHTHTHTLSLVHTYTRTQSHSHGVTVIIIFFFSE